SKWMKSAEVREMLGGISAAKLQSLRVNGLFPGVNADGLWLYSYDDIMDFLESNKTNRKEESDE
ncbi:MAG: helix-turn-helix domain-containing protein, partial [Candidatus Heimdallarchaeota archaeon]|nr:helix-turn-helix domain-containing protein [Candidatus Heimdallarchaeota archaeon]